MKELREIVARAGIGDADCIAELYGLFSRRVLMLSYEVLTGGYSKFAEDCAQDTWLRILSGLRNFDFESEPQLQAWINRIAINRAIDVRRRESQRAARESGGYVLQDNLYQIEPSKLVSECLRLLSEIEKDCFEFHHLRDFTYDEIQQKFGYSKTAIRGALDRSRSKIRGHLERLGIGQESI